MTTKRTVQFGLGLANGVDQVSELLEQARIADTAGIDFVSVHDHPYFGDRLDAYALLGVVLGATSNVSGAVICTNLLSRPAPVLARTITSLSALTRGRAILALGSSGMEEESVALGLPSLSAVERANALEESITIIKALSGGGDPVTFDGDIYKVVELPPTDTKAPPIWTGVGGRTGLGVTGRHADGWIPPHGADWNSALVADKRPLIDAAAVAAGRDPAEIGNVYLVTGDITQDDRPQTTNEQGRWNGGGIDQWVEALTFAVLERGAIAFSYVVMPGQSITEETANLWAREVAPAVRGAVARG